MAYAGVEGKWYEFMEKTGVLSNGRQRDWGFMAVGVRQGIKHLVVEYVVFMG